MWTRQPAELDGRRTIPAIGPGGPKFLSFQVQNLLFVCDPWDGSILWQRDDLEPGAGLYADARSGLAGDERCLFVLGADRTSYVLYETLTGRELRRGQLELESRVRDLRSAASSSQPRQSAASGASESGIRFQTAGNSKNRRANATA